MNKDSEIMYEKFTKELENFYRTGESPVDADQDMKYYLELQKKRLDKKHLRIQYQWNPTGKNNKEATYRKIWANHLYRSEMIGQRGQLFTNYELDGKRIKKNRKYIYLYQTVTHAEEDTDLSEEDYVCPNCGSVMKIKDLQEGCKYCGTRFKLNDLFPKVSNYFSLVADEGTKAEMWQVLKKFFLIGAIVMSIIAIIQNLNNGMNIPKALITGILAGCIGSPIGGYLIYVFWKLISIFGRAGKSVGYLAHAAGAEKKFMSHLSELNTEYSYEYFKNKAVSLLKTAFYVESEEEFVQYEGEPLDPSFQNIIDASLYGLVLEECHIEGDDAIAKVNVYIDVNYLNEGRIKRKSELFQMILQKKSCREINSHFSIQKIKCKECGGSFNALRERNCPYCGNRYEIEGDDWVVLSIKRK